MEKPRSGSILCSGFADKSSSKTPVKIREYSLLSETDPAVLIAYCLAPYPSVRRMIITFS